MAGQIVHDVTRPDADLIDSYEGVRSADAYDVVGKKYALDPAITPRTGATHLHGSAVTVWLPRGHNKMGHVAACRVAKPGDVIVIATELEHRGTIGDIFVDEILRNGINGIVSDGCVRDVEGFDERNLPVFSREVSPVSNVGETAADLGSINVPVTVGGTQIYPGDVVVGDGDGVVVIPQAEAESVRDSIEDAVETERRVRERIADGESIYDIRDYDDLLSEYDVTDVEEEIDYSTHRRY